MAAGAAMLIGVAVSPSHAEPIQIMSLGDSITFGNESSTGAGYRGPLQRLLTDAGIEYDFVGTRSDGPGTFDGLAFDPDHEGYPGLEADKLNLNGNSAVESLKRKLTEEATFANLAAANASPDVILLHIGTNTISTDTNSGNDDGNINSAHLQLGRLLDYLGAQINQGYLANDVTVLVARIIPKLDDNTHAPARETQYTQTQNYNSAIDEIVNASTIGGRVTLVDMFNGLQWGTDSDGNGVVDTPDTDYLSLDGIHPVDGGYDFMAQQWFGAMASTGHIPEPGALALVFAGGVGLLLRRRRVASSSPD